MRPSNDALAVRPDIATTSFWPTSWVRLGVPVVVAAAPLAAAPLAAVLGAGVATVASLVALAEALDGVAVPLADPEVALARETDDAGDAAPSAWTADCVADEEPVPDDAGGEAGAPHAAAIRTAVTVVASSAERERSGFIGTMASFRCGPASRHHCTVGRSHRPGTRAPP